MDRGRARYIHSEHPGTHQQKPPLPQLDPASSRMNAEFEDVEWTQASSMDHDRSKLVSQQDNPWIRIPVLIARSSALTIRAAAAGPTLQAVCIYASMLLLFWIIVFTTCTCEVIFEPRLWFLIPWAAVSCVEVLFSALVGQALFRNLMKGSRRMSAPFLLPILV